MPVLQVGCKELVASTSWNVALGTQSPCVKKPEWMHRRNSDPGPQLQPSPATSQCLLISHKVRLL